MKDFTYYAPTHVEFGRESEQKIGSLVKKFGGESVLIHYGRTIRDPKIIHLIHKFLRVKENLS